MSHFTLATGQRDIIWALTTQGIGFSCLFVPLSTVALSAIPRHQMADATGLNSLLRQVGGSIGLAVAATVLTRFGSEARTALVAHVTGGSVATMQRLRQMTGGFTARGFDALLGRNLALQALDRTVQQQSTLLAFEKLFLLAGITFLLVLPLLAFLKTPESLDPRKKPQPHEKVEVHVEM